MNLKPYIFLCFAGLLSAAAFTKTASAPYQTGATATIGIGTGIIDGNYIGGLNQFNPLSYTLYKSDLTKSGTLVSTVEALKKALQTARAGDKIYLNDQSTFNLSGQSPLNIPAGVTLFSGRGYNKSKGALIYSTDLKTIPMLYANGNNIRISGLRIKGPDGLSVNTKELQKARLQIRKASPSKSIDETEFKVYGIPNSRGIQINGKNITIDNCEIFNWSHAGIFMLPAATANIHHNYIHHNQRYGLGYGICLDGSYAEITANLFDFNRHAIAGTGIDRTSYRATYNVALANSTLQGHIFDMHGSTTRKDGAKLAGDKIEIFNNLFFVHSGPAIRIRGVPQGKSTIKNNEYILVRDKKNAFRQYKARQFSRAANVKQESQVEQYNRKTLDISNNSIYRIN